MATIPTDRRSGASVNVPEPASEAPGTDHLKQVPESRAVREQIRNRAVQTAARLDKSRPIAKHAMETGARAILAELDLPEGYVGWTMVALASAFWRDEVLGIPCQRRLLLLPHCLRNAESCPADYNELGLLCQDCGACRLSELRGWGRQKGYQVLIAEGSPMVLQIILAGQADAVLGVGCLDSLEKALDKILMVGLPAMAVPLHAATCRDTSTDEDWVREMIGTPYRSGSAVTRTRLHLLRCAAGMFQPEELQRLVPRLRGGRSLAETDGQGLGALDPLAVAEAVAHDFLLRGGKHSRPFITLATYDAMTGGRCCGPDGGRYAAGLPDSVKRIALAIEVFHKASLVHDDIEDDDAFRYGQPALHRKYDTATAINVGDYLIGLGYRLVASQRHSLNAEVVADIMAHLGGAHTKLCEGQGAELAWRQREQKTLKPLDALKIYALKTAPAFEAALYAGLRLAGPAEAYRQPAARFARHLGVAFQILNDLEDWDQGPNKRASGTDVLAKRPTVLWALALEGLQPKERQEMEALAAQATSGDEATIRRVRHLYERADVYQKAGQLVAKHRRRARDTADTVQPDELRQLLHYFVDTIVPRMKYER